jgi:hypothetical protein
VKAASEAPTLARLLRRVSAHVNPITVQFCTPMLTGRLMGQLDGATTADQQFSISNLLKNSVWTTKP